MASQMVASVKAIAARVLEGYVGLCLVSATLLVAGVAGVRIVQALRRRGGSSLLEHPV